MQRLQCLSHIFSFQNFQIFFAVWGIFHYKLIVRGVLLQMQLLFNQNVANTVNISDMSRWWIGLLAIEISSIKNSNHWREKTKNAFLETLCHQKYFMLKYSLLCVCVCVCLCSFNLHDNAFKFKCTVFLIRRINKELKRWGQSPRLELNLSEASFRNALKMN